MARDALRETLTPTGGRSGLRSLVSRSPSPRHSQSGDPFDEEFVNPYDGSWRWRATVNALALRSAASLSFSITNRFSPVPLSPTRSVWLASTLSDWKAESAIRVDVWERNSSLDKGPAGGEDTSRDESDATEGGDSEGRKKRRPAVINFHGGGFVLGSGTDDSRWITNVAESLDAVVFSVNYRLAPGYPYPTPVEDCVDAILQICSRADEFGFDTDDVFLSGFSAGSTLALASWVVLQDPPRWGYPLPPRATTIAGLVLFYPLLDWTVSRPMKRRLCVKPEATLPTSMTDLFDASYVYPPKPREDCDDPRLSPGLMPPEMLENMPPVHLCLCEYDMLLTEGLKFTERLREAGRLVTSRVVLGEGHGWDKGTPFVGIKPNVEVEYGAATTAMAHWLKRDGAAVTIEAVKHLQGGGEETADVEVEAETLRIKEDLLTVDSGIEVEVLGPAIR